MPPSTKERRGKIPDAPEDVVETREFHCNQCGRFLCYEAIVWGLVKIKCANCKTWNEVRIQPRG